VPSHAPPEKELLHPFTKIKTLLLVDERVIESVIPLVVKLVEVVLIFDAKLADCTCPILPNPVALAEVTAESAILFVPIVLSAMFTPCYLHP